MNWKAAKTSAWLSVLFLVVYGSCNWITSLRHDVGTFYFNWERRIPFVPLMIIPYMSIDLFFIAAPFLCRGDLQRRVFASRVTAAILLAGACFLLFPLRFAFDRPAVDGLLGYVFNQFRSLDQPFNQFPSLHITLRTILAVLYVQQTRGITRLAARVWFSLIGFSTLLTYQHHVIDVVGGFALAVICIYLFQEQSLRQPVTFNPRVGFYFIVSTILVAGLAWITRPVGLLLLWPALSLGMVSAAYFGLGPGIFRKNNGIVSPLSYLILWPVLLGQRISLAYYARRSDPWNVLTKSVWIGRKLSDREARQAIDKGVTAVLDLTGEFTEALPFRSLAYLQLSIMDLTAPPLPQLEMAVAFIRQQSATGIVYVHCKAGYSRTAAVAGAYLFDIGQANTVEQAITILRDARSGIVIRPEIVDVLHAYLACIGRSKVASDMLPAQNSVP